MVMRARISANLGNTSQRLLPDTDILKSNQGPEAGAPQAASRLTCILRAHGWQVLTHWQYHRVQRLRHLSQRAEEECLALEKARNNIWSAMQPHAAPTGEGDWAAWHEPTDDTADDASSLPPRARAPTRSCAGSRPGEGGQGRGRCEGRGASRRAKSAIRSVGAIRVQSHQEIFECSIRVQEIFECSHIRKFPADLTCNQVYVDMFFF